MTSHVPLTWIEPGHDIDILRVVLNDDTQIGHIRIDRKGGKNTYVANAYTNRHVGWAILEHSDLGMAQWWIATQWQEYQDGLA